MSEWHKNIPAQGVLCKWLDSIIRIMSFDSDGFLYDDNETDYCGSDLDYIRPLTAEEIWGFMPWQDIKTAPAFETILVIDDRGKAFPTAFMDENDIKLSRYKKWLPLTKGDL